MLKIGWQGYPWIHMTDFGFEIMEEGGGMNKGIKSIVIGLIDGVVLDEE